MSMSFWSAVATFGAAVLIFDAIAATVARKTGVDYRRFAVGSVFFYAGAGVTVALGVGPGSTWSAVTSASFGVGLLVGLIDSTVGWWISAVIGPGRVANVAKLLSKPASRQSIVFSGIVVTVGISIVCALVAGSLAWETAR
jgi:hypothetical protein